MHWKKFLDRNQKFLVEFIRILVEITGILVDTIFLIKSTRILIFTRIIISIRIILINIIRKFWFVHFPPELLFNSTRPFFSVWCLYQWNYSLQSCRMRKKGRKRSDTSAYVIYFRYIFYGHENPLSVRDDWLTIGRYVLPRSYRCSVFVARNYALRRTKVSWNPLYVARVPVLTTAARHEYRCKIRPPRCIVDPGEPPVHPSISPIDSSISRELRYS